MNNSIEETWRDTHLRGQCKLRAEGIDGNMHTHRVRRATLSPFGVDNRKTAGRMEVCIKWQQHHTSCHRVVAVVQPMHGGQQPEASYSN